MSENTSNSNYRSPLTRKIGVGLTRTNLSPGIRDARQRPLRDSPLLTPSRIIISGSSLGTHRTNSDRYASGYNRLGGQKNISEPNVSSAAKVKSDDIKSNKNDPDFSHNSEWPLRKNLSAASQLSKYENQSGLNVQRSQSANRGQAYLGNGLSNDRGVSLAGIGRTYKRLEYSSHKRNSTSVERDSSNTSADSTKLENYDLDLEQDEEDAVKDTMDGTESVHLDMTSPNSPSKDSGYHSPRIETNVDSFSCSVIGSRSGENSEPTQPRYTPDRDNCTVMPERPSRSKHSAKKKSLDQSKQLSESPWQQEAKMSGYSPSVTTDAKEDHVNHTDVKSDFGQPELAGNQRSRSQGQEESEHLPVAKPRARRRLTRRSISFRRLEDDEYIGFASLPEQVHRKAVRRGFEFTLMVVGETGLGKSTLINSLFLMDLYKDRKVGNIEERIQKTVELEKKELEIEERGVKLKLTIVDTPGFSDAVNAEESWKPIVSYIDKQFDAYFKAESGLNRKNIQDMRVHCCLYFISPYGHGLRPVDVMVMKKLHHKVNIIPLIAKADMLTKLECRRLKERVLQEIKKHNIHIYQYPDCDSDEDEEFKHQDKELKKSIPFAVVGSNTVVEAGGKKIRGRMYPWGIVEVENPLHSDFIKLRQMLISTHMQDLKDVTCDVHYENFRAEHISEQMTTTQRERGKLKRDSAANLDSAVATEKLLLEKDAEIKRMQEMLAKMQAQLQSNSPRPNGRIGQV